MSVDKPIQQLATPAKPPRIQGVKTKPLRLIPDERGWLLEILRVDDPEFFLKFGQTYVSATYPGVVKAWHYHQHQIDHFACVAGGRDQKHRWKFDATGATALAHWFESTSGWRSRSCRRS